MDLLKNMNNTNLTQALAILQKCVESPRKKCHLLKEEIKNADVAFEVALTAQQSLLNDVENITQSDEFNLISKYAEFQEVYQEPQFQLNDHTKQYEDLEKEYGEKNKNLTKHLEKQVKILNKANAKKILEIQQQIESEKAEFEETEKQLQLDLETLEDAAAFRQDIMETDLIKQLVQLNTMVNQAKSANNALKKEIEALQSNLKTNQPTNVVTFQLPGTAGTITPEMMSTDLSQYASIPKSNENNVNLSPQIFNTININLNQSKNTDQENSGVRAGAAVAKLKTFDINTKRATVASVPQTKKGATGGKYMALPISMTENKLPTEISAKKRQYNKKSDKKVDRKNSEEIIVQGTVKIDEPVKRKKRKLYNPELDFQCLKSLEEED